MIDFTFLSENLYSLDEAEKSAIHLENLNQLTSWHREHCPPYQRMLDALSTGNAASSSLLDVPYLPVQLFKLLKLSSVPDEAVIKILASSGTTGQTPSRIYLDRETSQFQTRALVNIMQSFIGIKRMPMVIIDTKSVLRDRASMTARGAGILGFSHFGRDHFYLLDDQYQIDWDGLEAFLERHRSERILLFGFTFIIWKYLYQACSVLERRVDFGNSVLIHGGGWKKLTEQSVDSLTFNHSLRVQCGIQEVHNYYGMVEQVGSIFMECEHAHLHAPSYSDVLARDPITLEALPKNQVGLLQVTSVLPKSYAGHSLLTEDLGVILGEDDCPCGRLGKYFSVSGRLESAEVRGCSDTHAYERGVTSWK